MLDLSFWPYTVYQPFLLKKSDWFLNSDKNRDISCQMVLLGSMALLHSRDCYASPLNIIFLRKFDDHQNKPLGPVGQRLKPPKLKGPKATCSNA